MNKLTAYLTLALSLAFAIAPALTSPFTGFTADQLPIPQIDPPVQPAGYAFAIWGLIYAWLIASAAYGVFKRAEDESWHKARLPLIFSLAIGVPWLAIANASAIWATITIILMGLGAIAALLRAPRTDRWLFQAPVGIYAGWLTAASCVSIATTFAGYGIAFDAYGWAIAGILIALAAALAVFAKRAAPEYLLTVIWALTGIIVAGGSAQVWISALAAVGILVLLAAILRSRTRPA